MMTATADHLLFLDDDWAQVLFGAHVVRSSAQICHCNKANP
jgi:hypothetical protein